MKTKTRFLFVSSISFALLFAFASSVVPQRAHAQVYPNVFVGRDLTLGSSGQDVVFLQGLLSEMGYLNVPISVPLGYFGSLTQSALAQYQAAIGVSPASGYFGSITKTAMTNAFASRGWLALLGFAR